MKKGIQKIFSEVSETYELVNHILTFGMDRGWRKKAAVAVKPVGFLILGSKAGYTYLSQTIPRFYSPEVLSRILIKAGFSQVSLKRLFFGIAAIHTGMKSSDHHSFG
jgi:demethylmenaquinone methyltransferase/2-methoxy-6-polyprenyl-1,4-benzoquinol methylase